MPKNEELTRYQSIIISTRNVVSRSILFVFAIVSAWRVTEIKSADFPYWWLILTFLPQAIETVYTVSTKHATEVKWVSPDVICFFLCAIPNIWIIELQLFQNRLTPETVNTTTTPITSTSASSNSVSFFEGIKNRIGNASHQDWALVLEQILIFVLITSKWIAPRGSVSRNELSQLLLVYISSGVDIVELFGAFDDERVRNSFGLVIATLTLWSWSLLQFTLHLTATITPPILDDDIDKMVALVNFFKYVNPQEADVSKSAWLQISEEINKGNLRVCKVNEKKGKKKKTSKPKSALQQLQLLPFSPSSVKFKQWSKPRFRGPHPSGVPEILAISESDDLELITVNTICFQLDSMNPSSFIEVDRNSFISPFPSGAGRNPFLNNQRHPQPNQPANQVRRPAPQVRQVAPTSASPLFRQIAPRAPTPPRQGIPHVPLPASPQVLTSEPTSSNQSDPTKNQSGAAPGTSNAAKETEISNVDSSSGSWESGSTTYESDDEVIQIEVPGSYKKGQSFLLVMPTKGHPSQLTDYQLKRQDGTTINPDEVKHPSDEAALSRGLFSSIGRNPFDCFCFYNEIWGLVSNLLLQDIPFLFLRLTILLYFQIVTRSIILFTFKNFFIIVLNLNRIRAIIKAERRPWLEFYHKVANQERKKEDDHRI